MGLVIPERQEAVPSRIKPERFVKPGLLISRTHSVHFAIDLGIVGEYVVGANANQGS